MRTLACSLLLLAAVVTAVASDTSVLLFGMLTVEKNASSCTYLSARIDYVPGTTLGFSRDEVAGTVICDASSSSSYLITLPASISALESSSHVLVKLYAVQKTGEGILAVREAVMVPSTESVSKLNVDVDMERGVRLDERMFASSLQGVECRAVMAKAFGRDAEGGRDEIWWVEADACAAAPDDAQPIECGRRPTLACAGIGLGAVITLGTIMRKLTRQMGGNVHAYQEGATKKAHKVEEEMGKTEGTPEKKVREWQREGDRLKRGAGRGVAGGGTTLKRHT